MKAADHWGYTWLKNLSPTEFKQWVVEMEPLEGFEWRKVESGELHFFDRIIDLTEYYYGG